MKTWDMSRVEDLLDEARTCVDNAHAVGLLTEAHLMAPSNYEAAIRLAGTLFRAKGPVCAGETIRLATLASQYATSDAAHWPTLKPFYADIARAYFSRRHEPRNLRAALRYADFSGEMRLVADIEEQLSKLEKPIRFRFIRDQTLEAALKAKNCVTESTFCELSVSSRLTDNPSHLLIRSYRDLNNLDAANLAALAHVDKFVCFSNDVASLLLERIPFLNPERVAVILYRPGYTSPTSTQPKERSVYVAYQPGGVHERLKGLLQNRGILIAEELDSSCSGYAFCSDKADESDICCLIKAQYLGAVPFCSMAPGLRPYMLGGRMFKLPYGREHIDAMAASITMAFDDIDILHMEGRKLAEIARGFFASEKMGQEWIELLNLEDKRS